MASDIVGSSRRPWLAPAIASGLAALVLLALTVGHVLRYPSGLPETVRDADLDAQRQTNQALRDQLALLREGAANVCEAVPGRSARDTTGADPLLPPPPARTPVTVVGTTDAPPAVSTLAGLLEKATVLVIAGDSLGSGFFISDRHIVTNHHVVGTLRDVRVGSRTLGGFEPARVVAVGAGAERGTQDLAVLEVAPKPGRTFLQVGVVPDRLQQLTAAGFPGAVLETIQGASASALPEANLTQGILTSRQEQAPASIGTIIHTAQIGHGNSGGPLVDAGGCAVGVNSWLSVDAEEQIVFSTYFQALDAGELKTFLKAHGIGFTDARAPCGPVRSADNAVPSPGHGPASAQPASP